MFPVTTNPVLKQNFVISNKMNPESYQNFALLSARNSKINSVFANNNVNFYPPNFSHENYDLSNILLRVRFNPLTLRVPT